MLHLKIYFISLRYQIAKLKPIEMKHALKSRGSIKALYGCTRKPFLGSNRIVFILILCFIALQTNAQSKLDFCYSMFYSNTNFNQYPVKFSSSQLSPKSDGIGFSFEFHRVKNKNLIGLKWMLCGGYPNRADSISGRFNSYSVLLGYGRQIALGERSELRPSIYLGMQSSDVLFTNKNNNSAQAIASGNTNELSLSSSNASVLLELEYLFKFKKKGGLGLFANYQDGIFKTSIFNISGAKVANAKYNPTAINIGIKLYRR